MIRLPRLRSALALILVLFVAVGGAVAAHYPSPAVLEDEILWCWPLSDEDAGRELSGGAPLDFTFPSTSLDVIVELGLGADLTADPLTWTWTDITQYVLHRDRIVISRGRPDGWSQVGPSQVAMTLDNSDGRFTRLNPLGAYYGQLSRNTPLRVSVDLHTGSGPQTRFSGYVSRWPPRWDKSGNDQYVPITADGIFRRLGQGDPAQSALYRTIIGASSDTQLLAYWPMEDGADGSQFASALPDSPDITITSGLTSAGDSTLVGSLPLPTVPASTVATVFGTIANTPTTGTSQTFDIWMNTQDPGVFGPDGNFDAYLTMADGARWDIFQESLGQVFLFYLAADGTGTQIIQSPDSIGFDQWNNIRMTVTQDGADVDAELIVDGVSVGTGTKTGVTLADPVEVSVKVPTETKGTSLGHFSVWDGIPATNFHEAGLGHAGEEAHTRLSRLCGEEGIPVSITGSSSAAMGPQSNDTLLNLLRRCADTDLGVLYETLAGEVGYRCNSDRYNASAALTLNYDSGHIHEPWAPQDDDQRLKNDVTVSRPDGSFARASDETSASSEGRYKQPWTANAEEDSQLAYIAGWLLHLGTWDELRYPMLGMKLHRSTDLINAWLAADVSDRIDLANLPSPVQSDSQQILEGYTETIGSFEWYVTVTLSPHGPYDVGVAGDDDTPGAWLQTGEDTQLVSALASGGTSATVVSDGPLFSTDAADIAYSPLSVVCGGEIMPVTAISSVVTDTFTRSEVNGWGTSDSGQLWNTAGGSDSEYSTNGTQGLITIPTGDTASRNMLLPDSYGDVDVVVTIQLPALTTGDEIQVYALARLTDFSNYYRFQLQFEPTGAVDLLTQSLVGGSVTTLDTTNMVATYTAGGDVFVRVQVIGSALKAKVWTSATEPAAWTVEQTDATHTSGQVGVRAVLSGGNTNVNPVIAFDDLEVVNPQTFTVTRTLAKTHAAASIVQVHRPFVASL